MEATCPGTTNAAAGSGGVEADRTCASNVAHVPLELGDHLGESATDVDSEALASIQKWTVQYLLKFKAVFPTHMQKCAAAAVAL